MAKEKTSKAGTPETPSKAAPEAKKPVAAKPKAATKPKAVAEPVVAAKPAAKPVAKPAEKPAKPATAAKATKKPAARAATKGADTVSGNGNTVTWEQRSHYIEVAAFYIAERRGFDSDPVADWLSAEAEIDRLLAEGRLG